MRAAKKRKPLKLFVILGALGVLTWIYYPRFHETEETQLQAKIQGLLEQRKSISEAIGPSLKQNSLPVKAEILWDGEHKVIQPTYTMDEDMQHEADRLLKTYKPDYAAIFLMDAENGRVLAMSSFQKDNPHADNWALQASFPAASVFKVVTATVAVDKAGVSPEQIIKYNGGAYTLYKKNVMSNKITRWTNSITLKDAFARSINTAFGRLSIERLHPEDLNDYATRFMFNQEIPTDFPVEMGVAYIPPDKGYEFAEAVSGFNKTNRMSPVQGAMIAASVANDGKMVIPYVVDEMKDEDGKVIYQASLLDRGQIMTPASAVKVRELMGQTVAKGTSRRTFSSLLRNKKFREITMGGKTGHLTGDNPKGRVDWFVGYAFDDNRKIAVAAITVNKQYWTVKSSYIGQSLFRKFFLLPKPTEADIEKTEN
jgi:cell division protein FtsI/penicillin-binding protein 2